jgi:hypothetical protein
MDTDGSDREERETPSAMTRRAVCTVLHFPQAMEKLEESKIRNQAIGAKSEVLHPMQWWSLTNILV